MAKVELKNSSKWSPVGPDTLVARIEPKAPGWGF